MVVLTLFEEVSTTINLTSYVSGLHLAVVIQDVDSTNNHDAISWENSFS